MASERVVQNVTTLPKTNISKTENAQSAAEQQNSNLEGLITARTAEAGATHLAAHVHVVGGMSKLE